MALRNPQLSAACADMNPMSACPQQEHKENSSVKTNCTTAHTGNMLVNIHGEKNCTKQQQGEGKKLLPYVQFNKVTHVRRGP